jgi:uncharacterized membrane protein
MRDQSPASATKRPARGFCAGFTFELALYTVETTVAPNWDDVGRVTTIAAIRTAVKFFLDRDVSSMRGFETQ